MEGQGNINVVANQVVRRTTRSQAVAGAGAGQSVNNTDNTVLTQTGVEHNRQTEVLDNSLSTGTQAKKAKGKKATKNSRPTVNTLSQAVTGLQEFASGSVTEMNVLRNEVTTNNQMITGLYSRMDNVMKAITDMSSQFNQINSARAGTQAAAGAVAQPPVAIATTQQVPVAPRLDNPPQVPCVQPTQAQLLGLPTPVELRREENQGGRVDMMVSQEDYRQPTGNGKTQNTTSDTVFYKPYMFLDREDLETVKERLDARKSMTPMEYVSATLSLLDDPLAHDPKDKDNILKHLLAVSIDARSRSWPGVRQWTQLIWDNVEKGRCSWESFGFIQDERVRVSYMNSTPSAHANTTTQQSKTPVVNSQDFNNVVCRDFNSPGGCKFNHAHDLGPIKYLHICSHCDSLGRRSHHSFQKCRTRSDQSGNTAASYNQQDHRQWNYNNRQSHNQQYQQNGQYNQYRNQQYQGQYSKNQ